MPTESLSERVTHSIREHMRHGGVTQASLASKLNLSQQAVSRRLTGEVPFSLVELDKVAAALGTTSDAFTADSASAPPADVGAAATSGADQ